jgi:hypothetical protein
MTTYSRFVSVVTQQTRRRWATVAVGVACLLCLPTVTSAVTGLAGGLARSQAPAPQVLMKRALASATIQHSGLAESTGTLGLPDLPQLTDVAAVLGGSTRTRVWWVGRQSWRVAVLTATGEQDTYVDHGRTTLWNYEEARLTEVVGTSAVRLPRAEDLLPPQAARRLLAGVGPGDRVQALPGRRSVAGLQADGLRIVPGDRRSTIGHVDVWLEAGRGLPVAIDVVDLRGTTALRSAFLDLELAAPEPAEVRIPPAPGAMHDSTDSPDLATRIQRFNGRRLPALPGSLVGVATSDPIVGGTATYGTGLVRFIVSPLPGRLADQVLDATRTGGGTDLARPGGEALLVSSGLINLVVARTADRQRAYLLAGLVTGEVLGAAAGELLQLPPQQEFG